MNTIPDRTGEPFILTRRFAAPRALAFAALPQAGHLERWMGPQGFEMSHGTIDPRPGGSFHYVLRCVAQGLRS